MAEALLGAAVTAGVLWSVGKVYKLVRKREGLGFGDIKMLLAIGAFLGLPASLLTVMLGSILGVIVGGLFIWLSKEDMTYELPLGSFLGIAAIFVGHFGEGMGAWYLSLGA